MTAATPMGRGPAPFGPRKMPPEAVKHILLGYTAGDESVYDIAHRHRHAGFSTVGVHFVIRRDGTVEQGRSIDHSWALHPNAIVAFANGPAPLTDPQRAAWRSLKHDMLILFPQATPKVI